MSRKMMCIACLSILAGCMDTRECKQTCWPHPVRVFSQTLGGTSCGCVQDPPPPATTHTSVAMPAGVASSIPTSKPLSIDGF